MSESQELWGDIDSDTIGSVIDEIYQGLFNRAPEAEGKQFYVDGFNAGDFTPGTIVLDVLNGTKSSAGTDLVPTRSTRVDQGRAKLTTWK